MARYTCPSCGANYNGRKCRNCFYEHFSEEIAHGAHTHRGEPLVIDAPRRRPIPRKDPFGCEKQSRRWNIPRRKRKQRPFAGLLSIFLVLSALLPMVRNWGLELEAREARYQAEMALPEDLVTLYEEGPITISTSSRYLNEFTDSGLRLWVKNDRSDADVYVTTKYVMADGFVMPHSGVYIEGSAGAYGMGTLYLNGENLLDAGITNVRELTFVLECTDDGYATLFETDPITITREIPVQPEPEFDGPVLMDSDGLRILDLSYIPDPYHPRYENGWRLFYVENNTDEFLSMSSLDVTVGSKAVDLFLWCALPAQSRAVVRLDLRGLEALDFTSPSELENINMTLEFRNPDNASGKEYQITIPMVNKESVVIR